MNDLLCLLLDVFLPFSFRRQMAEDRALGARIRQAEGRAL